MPCVTTYFDTIYYLLVAKLCELVSAQHHLVGERHHETISIHYCLPSFLHMKMKTKNNSYKSRYIYIYIYILFSRDNGAMPHSLPIWNFPPLWKWRDADTGPHFRNWISRLSRLGSVLSGSQLSHMLGCCPKCEHLTVPANSTFPIYLCFLAASPQSDTLFYSNEAIVPSQKSHLHLHLQSNDWY